MIFITNIINTGVQFFFMNNLMVILYVTTVISFDLSLKALKNFNISIT